MKKNLFSLKIAVVTLGMLFSKTASADYIAVASGDWSDPATWGGAAPTATVSGQNIQIPSGIAVNLDADVTFSSVLGTFMVNGALTSTTTNAIIMETGALTGAGTISIGKLTFKALGTTAFAGTLNVKHLNNSTATLAFTAIANISDTLDLESGNILVNTNANITMAAGSTLKSSNGGLIMNSGILNTGNAYNVMYTGTSKVAGPELNSATIQNLYLRLSGNTQTVTLNNNLIINGNLDMTSGIINLDGKTLTLKGDLISNAGTAFESDNASNMIIEGSGALTGSLMFIAGSDLNTLTINRTNSGQVKLASAVNINNGFLNLIDGNLSIENGGTLSVTNVNSMIHVEKGTLSLNSGTFNGNATYNVEYTGVADVTSGVELTGSGLTNVMINYSSSTNKVTLNGNATVASKFELIKGKIDLNGKNLILNGTFSQNSNAWIIGNTASELHLNLSSVGTNTLMFDNANASSQTLGKLRINTAGANSIVLGSKLMISNELTFIAGKLELGNGDLEIMSAATISGYDDTKYIITSDNNSGVLIQNVNSGSAYVTFPVGLSTNYSPAYVQQTSSGTSGNFSVKCYSLYTSAMLKAVNRQWMVEGMNITTVNANLKFGWKTTEELNGFDRTNAYVSHYTNSTWDVSSSSSATLGVNSTYEMSRMGLTSLSPFAVVESGQPLAIKEVSKLQGFELYPNPSKDVLNIKILNTANEYQYELIDVTGRTIVTTTNSNSINKFDVSSLGAGCYFIKIKNLDDNKTETRRFIKQ